LLTLLCFAVSGVRAYEVQESYNTTQKKRTYESDYIKIVCDDFDSQGIKIGGLLDRFITITAKHATFKKVVLTVTHADYVREFRKSKGGGNLSIDGKTITITYSNNPTVVQFFSDHYDHFTIVDHIDVYYEPTDLAPNSAGEYSISNESEWVLFCKMVNEGGKTFSGKKVNMLNDISITGNTQNAATTMVGTKIVKNATIQNLRVADTIKCFSYSGGIIGATEGLVTLKNCHSEVNLTKYRDGGQDIGGLIGCCNSSGSLNIEGCCYTGQMELSQTYCGGIVGYIYSENNPVNISNCMVKPSSVNCGSQSCSTFASRGTFNNCYYFTTIGNAQGKKARKISAKAYEGEGVSTAEDVTLENAGTPATDYTTSGITAYSTGLKYNNEFYAGNGDVVSLALTPTATGYAVSGVETDHGTLSGAKNPY
jgi:hypothetical protein